MIVRVVLTGRGYDAAEALPSELTLPNECSIDDALGVVAGHLSNGQSLSGSSLIAVNGQHLGSLRSHREAKLREGDELMIIAPVAGG